MRLIALLSITLTCFISCTKDKNSTTPPPVPLPPATAYLDYIHLKQGNYWIYQVYEVDTAGNGTPLPVFDSVYAGPEFSYGGKVCQVRMVPDAGYPGKYAPELYRDSLHYLLYNGSMVYSSSEDFTHILSQQYLMAAPGDTVAHISTRMTDKNALITMPAGSFPTISRCEEWLMYPKYRRSGAVRKRYIRFAATVGIISETLLFYADAPYMLERRLIRYHVQ